MNIIKEEEFNTIFKTSVFDSEVSGLFGKSKASCKKFLTSLYSDLQRLDVQDTPPSTYPFKKIKGVLKPIYRIEYKDKENNVRTIYYWHSQKEKILLTAFKEKDISDYREAIDRALARLKELGL